MKLTGITGGGTGRLGNAVFSAVRGATIVRQYQPNVANPQTEGQVNQRTKFKLMSQLAAALAPAISIARDGMKTGRNQFVSINIPNVVNSGDAAAVIYENLQLTKSSIAIPAITASRTTESSPISIRMAEAPAEDVKQIAYFVFSKNAEGALSYVTSALIAKTASNPTCGTTIPSVSGDIVIYAYGQRVTSEQASARYANYFVTNASDLAALYATKSSMLAGSNLTRTRGLTLNATATSASGATSGDTNPVYISALSGQGTITATAYNAEGTRGDRLSGVVSGKLDVPVGGYVTIAVDSVATGYEFDRFIVNGVSAGQGLTQLAIRNITSMQEVIMRTRRTASDANVSIVVEIDTAKVSRMEVDILDPETRANVRHIAITDSEEITIPVNSVIKLSAADLTGNKRYKTEMQLVDGRVASSNSSNTSGEDFYTNIVTSSLSGYYVTIVETEG